MKHKLYAIDWEDSTCIAEWHDTDGITDFRLNGAWCTRNVGYLVSEDDECFVLAARITEDGEHAGLLERIPKRAVVLVHDLSAKLSTFDRAVEDWGL